MSGKYEDLYGPMINDETFDLTMIERMGAKITLQWLDENIDQVPGRTITESEFNWRTSGCSELEAYWFKVGYFAAGGNIVADPEPTNAEKLNSLYGEWADDPSPTKLALGEWLELRGVKAPGGDDD